MKINEIFCNTFKALEDFKSEHCQFGLNLCHTDITDPTDINSCSDKSEHCLFGLNLCHTDITDPTDVYSCSDKSEHCQFGLNLCHTDITDPTDINTCSDKKYILMKSERSVQSVCQNKTICVVESEKTAVIMSEVKPVE